MFNYFLSPTLLTATWTEHCHCTGNINLSQRWEFWIDINTKHIQYLPTILIYSFIQFSTSSLSRLSEDWSSLAKQANKVTFSWCWQSLVGKKLCLVLSWLQHFWSLVLWSSAWRFYVTKTEIKSMPNICLSWLELEPGIGREMNLKCFSTIYVPARSVRVIEISALSPHVTISHLLELCWSSQQFYSFGCTSFWLWIFLSDLMRLFVRSCATLIHRKIHSLGGDLIRSRLGNN